MPRFRQLLFPAVASLCLALVASGMAAAQNADPIYLQSPYDEITLDENNNNAVLKIKPLNLPGRKVPAPENRSGDLEIELIEHALVLDLLMSAPIGSGPGSQPARACGLSLHVLGEGTHDGVGAVRARAVVLATGGMGQVFAATTNPSVSTGDGTCARPALGIASAASATSRPAARESLKKSSAVGQCII